MTIPRWALPIIFILAITDFTIGLVIGIKIGIGHAHAAVEQTK